MGSGRDRAGETDGKRVFPRRSFSLAKVISYLRYISHHAASGGRACRLVRCVRLFIVAFAEGVEGGSIETDISRDLRAAVMTDEASVYSQREVCPRLPRTRDKIRGEVK